MQYGKWIIGIAVLLLVPLLWGALSNQSFIGEIPITSTAVSAAGHSHGTSEPDMTTDVEYEVIDSDLPSSEFFESEFRSSPTAILRAEVKSVDSALDPILEVSNKRALTLEERAHVARGLRKRQALLKIIIDRQIDESKVRAQL